jgi:CBS domain-containing protein
MVWRCTRRADEGIATTVALEQTRLREFAARPLTSLELAAPTIVSTTDSLASVIAAIRDHRDSCALVRGGGGLEGIVTERDVLCSFLDGEVDWNQPVSAVMTSTPATLSSAGSILDAIQLMRQRDFRTVPIVDGDEVRGVVRLGDVLRELAETFPEEILNLPPRPHQTMEKPEGA